MLKPIYKTLNKSQEKDNEPNFPLKKFSLFLSLSLLSSFLPFFHKYLLSIYISSLICVPDRD